MPITTSFFNGVRAKNLNIVGGTPVRDGDTVNVTVAGGGSSPLTTKGDVYGYSTADARIPVGANGEVLTADSTVALGLKWAAVAGTGDVTAASNLGDNLLIRGDGASKGVQNSGISIDDSDNVTGMANLTATGALLSGLTASQIVITDASKNLASAAVATYPSLAELIHVKGVTSAIQTQLNAKGVGNALTSNPLSQFAATTSAQLAGVISNETGTGALVFGTSPTLVTPALGTPSALVGTNITGTAAGLTAGTVTTNANLTGDVTSAGNATTIAAGAVDLAMLSATGTPTASNFLRGDNTWATPAGSGDMVLADAQTVTGLKTFDTTKLAVKGSSTGSTAIASANAGATDYTATLPAANGTFLFTDGSAASLTSFPTLNQSTTGSAATLTTPRAINGTNFDGSADITVTAAAGTLTGTTLNATVVTSSLTAVGTIATGVWSGTAIALNKITALTASEIVISDASGFLASAPVATYPSLTELTYVKGVTSAIQTQLDSKGAGTVTSVTSANADATVATTTTTPVITIVQTPALRSATTTVDVSAATAPTAGQVLKATSATTATWQTLSGSVTFVDNEVVSGSTGTSFVLAGTPTAGSVHVYLNGMRGKVGDDYTISGDTITTTLTQQSGTVIADYRT